jgi:hypothetical protein
MNETPTPNIETTLEKALIDSIDGIKKTGTELVDALYQQAPEVIEQLLMWHGVESFILFICSTLFLTLPFIHYKHARMLYDKMDIKDSRGDPGDYWIPVLLSGTASFAVGVGFFFNLVNLKWLKIWLAPKVYLLEYLAEFVK